MKILFAGDFAPVARLSTIFNDSCGDSVLQGVADTVKSADFSIVNLEAPLGVGTEFKIKKSGPHLSCNYNSIIALKKAGFSACSLANNHMRDYGSKGVNATIEALDSVGLTHVGAGKNIEEARKPLVRIINGKKVTFIAVCETEYSIASHNQAGSAPMDIIETSKRIIDAKTTSDYVILITHGGHEYYHYPSPRMKKLYRYFIDMGADAVINHHQHCINGYELYNDKLIVYGVGNFCFDRSDKRFNSWNDGYMVSIDFQDIITFELIPYIQCNERACVNIAEGDEKERILNQIAKINEVILDDNLLDSKHVEFIMNMKKKNIMAVFSPYLSDKLRIAAGHHLIPYLLPKSKIRAILNMIQCEAHYDETIQVLTKYISEK